jgi:hypothetical protein
MLIITKDSLGHLTERTPNMSIANKVVVLCKQPSTCGCRRRALMSHEVMFLIPKNVGHR